MNNYFKAAMLQMLEDVRALDEALEAYNSFNISCVDNKEIEEKTMLKNKTILALLEDGSNEALQFALPYAAELLRKIIADEEEAQYIKDEREGKLLNNMTTDWVSDGVYFVCENCGQTYLLPYNVCPACGKGVIDIREAEAIKNPMPIKTQELCNTCQRAIDCVYLPCCDCEMGDTEYETGSGEHYTCKCEDTMIGEPCPHYIEYKE